MLQPCEPRLQLIRLRAEAGRLLKVLGLRGFSLRCLQAPKLVYKQTTVPSMQGFCTALRMPADGPYTQHAEETGTCHSPGLSIPEPCLIALRCQPAAACAAALPPAPAWLPWPSQHRLLTQSFYGPLQSGWAGLIVERTAQEHV